MDSILWPGKELPPISVSLEINTLGFNKNILQPGLHRTGHSFRLSVPNISSPYGLDPQPYSFRSIHNKGQTEGTTDSLDQWWYTLHGCDPLSPAACPVLVISRLMRPEVTITFLIIQQQSLWMSHRQTFVHTSSFWDWTKPKALTLPHP